MRIGIDIDGVLTDYERWQMDCGSKFAYENGLDVTIKADGYDSKEVFDWGVENDNKFWKEIFVEYFGNAKARNFCGEIIEKLHNDGNEIYIVTARDNCANEKEILPLEESNNLTINWLKKNNIYYDKILFTPQDKLEVCLKNKIDVMIEDSPRYLEKLSNVIPVICYNANYNQNHKNEKLYRAYSWYDVYQKIRTMK